MRYLRAILCSSLPAVAVAVQGDASGDVPTMEKILDVLKDGLIVDLGGVPENTEGGPSSESES